MTQTIALIGQTAVGKTDVSIELAKRLRAQIVGCDSMQVYRGMAALTQQPTLEQRAAVTHHLVDCVEPAESFSVGQYRPMALAAIHAIHQQGQPVVLVGGTGLYLKALTKGLCSAPPADDHVRAQLWEAIQQQGSPVFHERLQRIDPLAASKIHPNDARRLVRALEVYELTGKPLSNFWKQSAETDWSVATAPALQRMVLIGLTRDRDKLYERINRRVERMIREEGVLEDVKQLQNVPLSQTARKVHGLAFLEAYLRGAAPLEETIRAWQQQVRNYARRQLTWFRADPRIRWITIAHDDTPERIVEQILEGLQWNAPCW